MSVKTGENEQGLKKIMDLTRAVAIIILLLHFYYHGYVLFQQLAWSAKLSDRLLSNIVKTGLFHPFYKAKIVAVIAISLSLIGTKGKKEETASIKNGFIYIAMGLVIYFGSYLVSFIDAALPFVFGLYMLLLLLVF